MTTQNIIYQMIWKWSSAIFVFVSCSGHKPEEMKNPVLFFLFYFNFILLTLFFHTYQEVLAKHVTVFGLFITFIHKPDCMVLHLICLRTSRKESSGSNSCVSNWVERPGVCNPRLLSSAVCNSFIPHLWLSGFEEKC